MAAFGRRDRLREIEKEVQEQWAQEKTFETQYDPTRESFLVTFPYPYMNGPLHLGHGFTITKAEFAARYQMLKGKNALFPFGFHCTGMPIQSAAFKLKREITNYGCPPKLPEAEEAPVKKVEEKQATPGKFKGKKSKTVKKTGNTKLQWDILKLSQVPEEEIPKFQDPNHWLTVFPVRGESDLKAFGLCIDWRRSFITTSKNQFYDKFIRWQFTRLKESNYVAFGKRPTIYSPFDKQACMDHDRDSGAGVNPQEYTLIKIKVKELAEVMKPVLEGKEVFLVAATLRPETMYGQTNCFVLPDGQYGAYEMKTGEVFVCSERSATNMAYQDMTESFGVLKCLMKIKGKDLIGLPLKAPRTSYDTVYTLPLLTISMTKGTGVVTSVPSDAPDDYAALRDWQTDEKLRKKHGVKEEWVKGFEVIPIITIEGYGDKAAVFLCDKLKIKSQKDKAKLKEAKDEVYLKGFYEGVMMVGSDDVKGKKVFEAKPIVRKQMIEAGEALSYFEPESKVMSRSGDECVVTFLDQWFIKYGEEDWCNRVKEHVSDPSRFNAYTDNAKKAYNDSLGWLKEWACSRSFGLGTQVPWDEKFVIESLSDSTIYMAYYSIAHVLQGRVGGELDGSKGSINGISPESLTPEVFDYIFLKKEYPTGCDIPKELLDEMRKEFEYWYPMDLRVSGKDLIPNHLTMSLYNHASIWKDSPAMWPKGFFTNGHVLIDAEKMAKSRGNFVMLDEACRGHRETEISGKKVVIGWCADATRLTCADGGDGMEDANFAFDTANQAILRLTTELDFVKSVLEDKELRTDDSSNYTFHDKAFAAKMNYCVEEADAAYAAMRFRDALKYGFYGLQGARDSYRDACTRLKLPMHKHLLMEFINIQTIVLSPICPHFAEHVWRKLLGHTSSVSKASWPKTVAPDRTLVRSAEYIDKIISTCRSKILEQKDKATTHVVIMISKAFPEWKQIIIKKLAASYDSSTKQMPKDIMKQLKTLCTSDPVLKPMTKKAMQVASFFIKKSLDEEEQAFELEVPFNEKEILLDNEDYVVSAIGIRGLILQDSESADVEDPKLAATAEPGAPAFALKQA